MSRPLKIAGFQQGHFDVSSLQKEMLGRLTITDDGRKFRYAQAGASALHAGYMAIGNKSASTVVKQAGLVVPTGTTQINFTITSATFASNYFAGGYLQINSGTGQGLQYLIQASSAVTAGTSITIGLAESIQVALDATTYFTLVPSPWALTTESSTATNIPAGVSPIAVAANYYYWAQTGGIANVLISGTPAIGSILTLGGVAGSLAIVSTTIATEVVEPIVGIVVGTGTDTQFSAVKLLLD